MNKEKLIKNQALTSLKGSWIILIAMVLTISAVMIAIYSMGSIVQLITKSLDTATGMAKSGKEFTFTLISIIDLVVMFFLTPLINGFFKSVYTVAHNEIPSFWEIFSFFKSPKLYFKTILLNLIFVVILSLAFFAFDFGYLVTMITDSLKTSNTALTTLITAVLNIVFGAVSVLLISFVYLFFVNYAMFLFIDDSNSNVFCCFGNTMKLYFSFAGWIALCFFVVPAFYVLPYISTSFATSAKWLISIEKGRN